MEKYTERKRHAEGINYLKLLGKIVGTRNKARILFADVFPCKEFMVQRYQIENKKGIYMFYLIRFGTALHRGLNVLWQLPHYILELRSRKT